MPITELTKLIPPPGSPNDAGAPGQEPDAKSLAGTALPKDYIDYGMQYGTGSFCNGFLRVFNPFSPYYEKWLDSGLLILQKSKERDELGAFDVFPTPGGLLPWGDDENGDVLCWKSVGNPDKWTVVVRPHDSELEEWQMSLSSFLVQALTNKIKVEVWHEPFSEDEFNFLPG